MTCEARAWQQQRRCGMYVHVCGITGAVLLEVLPGVLPARSAASASALTPTPISLQGMRATSPGAPQLEGATNSGGSGPISLGGARGAFTKGVCQVDGCYADLTGLRDYHLRYKICEYHLKVRGRVWGRVCRLSGRGYGRVPGCECG
jgi:hypothetical protein